MHKIEGNGLIKIRLIWLFQQLLHIVYKYICSSFLIDTCTIQNKWKHLYVLDQASLKENEFEFFLFFITIHL